MLSFKIKIAFLGDELGSQQSFKLSTERVIQYSHKNVRFANRVCICVCVETGPECDNVEKVSLLSGTETSNKNVEKKIANAKIEIPAKEQNKEVSEVVKTLRKRREDMAGKDEKKLKEEKERSAIEKYTCSHHRSGIHSSLNTVERSSRYYGHFWSRRNAHTLFF